MPRLIEADIENERILKEYIEGNSIYEYVLNGKMKPDYLEQIKAMCGLLYPAKIEYSQTMGCRLVAV